MTINAMDFSQQQCPRCQSFEMLEDDDGYCFCLVCGYDIDPRRSGEALLPHYSIGYYHRKGLGKGIEEDSCMPVDSLDAAEAWLQDREKAGYRISKCVLVNEHGHVIWLRGSPRDWNFSGK